MTTTENIRTQVFRYMQNHWFASELAIARALGLPVLDVLDAMLDLQRTDRDVIERDGVIGYIGHTDRAL